MLSALVMRLTVALVMGGPLRMSKPCALGLAAPVPDSARRADNRSQRIDHLYLLVAVQCSPQLAKGGIPIHFSGQGFHMLLRHHQARAQAARTEGWSVSAI